MGVGGRHSKVITEKFFECLPPTRIIKKHTEQGRPGTEAIGNSIL